MYGQICDNCDERVAHYKVNVIRVKTDNATGNIETHSRDEDWCKECIQQRHDYWDKPEPKVGDTWTEKGDWWQGQRRGKFKDTFTIEDAPAPPKPFLLVPACPCCGEEFTGAEHWALCTGCTNPEHRHS